jgi:hypothetical protein
MARRTIPSQSPFVQTHAIGSSDRLIGLTPLITERAREAVSKREQLGRDKQAKEETQRIGQRSIMD